MDKEELISLVTDANITGIKTSKILGWINALPNNYNTIRPNVVKLGDVLMHPVFKHPYIILAINDDGDYLSGLMTSDGDCREVLMKCASRFFPDKFITKTLFVVSKDSHETHPFMGVYDNPRHLKVILKKVKESLK